MSLRWLVAVLMLACMGTALAIVKSRHGNRTAFVELQQLEARRDELAVEWGQLQLEQSAWSTHARIEQVARQELEMTIVREARIVLSRDAD